MEVYIRSDVPVGPLPLVRGDFTLVDSITPCDIVIITQCTPKEADWHFRYDAVLFIVH